MHRRRQKTRRPKSVLNRALEMAEQDPEGFVIECGRTAERATEKFQGIKRHLKESPQNARNILIKAAAKLLKKGLE